MPQLIIPPAAFPPNTGRKAFLFKLVSRVGGRKLSLCAHRCLEYTPPPPHPSVWRSLGHRVGLIRRDGDLIARHYIPVMLGKTDYRCTYVTVTPFLAPESWLFPRGQLQLETRAPLTSTSVLPWVYGEFCEYKLWQRQMIIHCWWAGSSAVLLHQ